MKIVSERNITESLSVVMAFRNEKAYVSGTVASVLSQGSEVGQILLVDSNSTDGTPEMLHNISKSDSRCEFHQFGKRHFLIKPIIP